MVKSTKQAGYDRGRWLRPAEFLLTSLGFSVGMGTLWKFPYMCIRNGGGSFLFTYCLFTAICGVPLFFLETCLGQYVGRGALTAWYITPLFKGLGLVSTLISTVCAVYYNTLIGWNLYYISMSFAKTLPWTSCNNDWNSPSCVSVEGFRNNSGTLNWGKNDSTTGVASSEEFWQRHVLNISERIEDIGSLNWKTALCLTAAWIITFLILFKGIKSARKVVYITATLPLILMVILMIRGATLPGAYDGVMFYITPDWNKLAGVQAWLEGIIFGLYSLGPGWGSVITFSSFNDFHNNAFMDSIVLSVVTTLVTVMAGFTIFTSLGYTSYITQVPIDRLPNSGPGLMFVAYPFTAALLPVPQLWTVLFFLTMFFVAVDSEFAMVKVFISGLADLFPDIIGRRITLVTLIFCIMSNAVSLLFVSQGGMYYYVLIDWYASSLALVTVTFFQTIVIGWIYGIDRFLEHLREMMPGCRSSVLFIMKYVWKYLTPSFALVVLIVTLARLKPPNYAGYEYPEWAVSLGWTISALSVLPFPAVMLYEILQRKGGLLKRLKSAVKPVVLRRGHGNCDVCQPEGDLLCKIGDKADELVPAPKN